MRANAALNSPRLGERKIRGVRPNRLAGELVEPGTTPSDGNIRTASTAISKWFSAKLESDAYGSSVIESARAAEAKKKRPQDAKHQTRESTSTSTFARPRRSFMSVQRSSAPSS